MVLRGLDLPLSQEAGCASTAGSDSKSMSSGCGHGHPGHIHTVLLEADGTFLGGATGQEFCLGRSSCLAEAFAGQPYTSGWKSTPRSTPTVTELPHNLHLMQEGNLSKDTVIIFFILIESCFWKSLTEESLQRNLNENSKGMVQPIVISL